MGLSKRCSLKTAVAEAQIYPTGNLSCSSSGCPSGASAFAQPLAAQCHPPGPSARISTQWPRWEGHHAPKLFGAPGYGLVTGSPCRSLLFCPASASGFLSHLAHCLPRVPIWPHFLPHVICLCLTSNPTPQRHVPDRQNSCWFCIFQDKKERNVKEKLSCSMWFLEKQSF